LEKQDEQKKKKNLSKNWKMEDLKKKIEERKKTNEQKKKKKRVCTAAFAKQRAPKLKRP
jgi:hypothetical protein